MTALACGSDSGSGVSSGVDTTKPANMVSASDAQKVCSAIASYYTNELTPELVRRTVCIAVVAVQSVGMAPTVDQCNASVNDCVANAQGSNGMTAVTPPQVTCPGGVVPAQCTATVGEIQSCATEIANETHGKLASINCGLYGLPPADAQAMLRAATTVTVPADCSTVQQSCPGIFAQLTGATAPAPSSS
jgi:hypothetical protein